MHHSSLKPAFLSGLLNLSYLQMWDSTSVGEENKRFFIRVLKPLPSRRVLKSWGEARKGKPKKTISTSDGLKPLQMVSEPDTGWCASKEAKSWRGWTWGSVSIRMLGSEKGVDWGVSHRLEKGMSVSEDAEPRRGWIVRCHIGWGGERNILYKGVQTCP